MSIASRIEAIEQHLTDDYSVLTLAGADLTNVDKNIINLKPTWKERLLYFINNGTDVVWNNWEKVEGTGESLSLNSTEEAPMKIDLKGNTSQETSILPSGYTQVDYIEIADKQYINTGLFPDSNLKIETKIEVASTNQDITVFGSSLASSGGNSLGGYYHLTPYNDKWYYGANNSEGNGGSYSAIVGTQYEIIFNDEDGGIKINGTSIASNKTFVGISDSTLTIARRGTSSARRFGHFKYFYFKIYNKNTNALVRDYIPCYRNSDNEVGLYDLVNNVFYTNAGTGTFTKGNNTSIPNPDYPQDIHVVSGDNTIKVEGKNLFDKSNATYSAEGRALDGNGNEVSSLNYKYTTSYINVKPTTQYTIQGLFNSSSNVTRIYYYTKDNEWIARSDTFNVAPYTFTTPNNCEKIRFLIYNPLYNENTIQIEQGLATPYETYKGASYPINLGDIELCKIGNYQDSIVKDNGKWYLNKQINKVVLNGSWPWGTQGTTNYQCALVNANKLYLARSGIGLSNYFRIGTSGTDIFLYPILQAGIDYIRISNATIKWATLDNFKAFITNNSAVFYYPLATLTYTEITDSTLLSQLEALYNAKSKNSQTNLTQENNDLPFILDVTALKQLTQ